jgi:predicted MPP superfamily phosphohydrolase
MKLGLITDIHEHVEHLKTALERFQEHHVDQIVMIGDVFEMGQRIEETCRLLAEASVIGVWGNHDYGLCFEPDDDTRAKYGEVTMSYMTSLRPRLVVEDCHFSHVEPWLNPEEIADLWYFEGTPDGHGKLARIFEAVTNRLMFAGHYHKWLLVRPDGIQDWDGTTPVLLNNGRYFVVVGALCEGRYAILDTDTSTLTPSNED